MRRLPLFAAVAVTLACAGVGAPAAFAGSLALAPQSASDHLASPDCTVTSSWWRSTDNGVHFVSATASITCAVPQPTVGVRLDVVETTSHDSDLPRTTPAAGGDIEQDASSASDTVTMPAYLARDYTLSVDGWVVPADGTPMTIGPDGAHCAEVGLSLSCSTSYEFLGADSSIYTAPQALSASTAMVLTSSAGMRCEVSLSAASQGATAVTFTGATGPDSCTDPNVYGIVLVYADPLRDANLVLGTPHQQAPGMSEAVADPAPPAMYATYYLEAELTDGSTWTGLPGVCATGFHNTTAVCQLQLAVRLGP